MANAGTLGAVKPLPRIIVPTTVLALVLAACGSAEESEPGTDETSASPRPSASVEPSESESASTEPSGPVTPEITGTVARDLETPWGLAFLPDGTAIVTERDSARVLAIEDTQVREIGTIDAAAPRAEAGLLGAAVSPDFADDGWVYFYLTTDVDNRVVRARYDGEQLGRTQTVYDGIPLAPIHDGGRIRFGPDSMLYVATGDAAQPDLAQDPGSPAGKVLRMTPEGEPAPDNPGGSVVWTLGHRNIQGLAFTEDGDLWASEFGQDEADELNRIEAGDNYGWPQVEGRGGPARFTDPVHQWATDEASPSGLAYAEGSLWMAALRGRRLWQIPIREDGSAGRPRAHFVGDLGRLRTVEAAPDGTLWLTTSNRDGRGDPADQDDRILVVELTRE